MSLARWGVAASFSLCVAVGSTGARATQQPSTAKYDGPTCFATVLPALNTSAATVLESRDKPQMVYSTHDRLYARSGGATLEPGQEYVLYREETELRHPDTGAVLGTVVNLLGRARVLATEGDRVLLVVTEACAEIEPGDSLHPLLEQSTVARGHMPDYDPDQLITPSAEDAAVVFGTGETVRLPNANNARGSLNVLATYGLGDVVTLDQGSESGWQPGAAVLFYRPPGPMARGLAAATEAVVLGQGLVFWVESSTAAVMITHADRAVELGARVVRLR